MTCRDNILVDRRRLIAGSASLALWGAMPRSASARTGDDPRLLVIVLRGGLDGLSMAAPVGDPAYAGLRGRLALSRTGDKAGLPLDDLFVLNPAMPKLHALYLRKEAVLLHAVATPYRGRSHFDGQDVLESGLGGVGRSDDGWLNRALAGLAKHGGANPKGLASGSVVPLIMRGPAPVLTWAPKAYNLPAPEATIARLADLYAATDPALAKALAEGVAAEKMGAGAAAANGKLGEFVAAAQAAARFLCAPDGPRVGTLSFDGWDTHANEGAVTGVLANRLGGLDAAIGALADGMGAAWRETIVAVVTEFGRTARANGTDGTDHGTGMATILAGGAIAGGRVIADWPGLADAALYEGRDLKPTTDLRAVLKGLLADHLGVPAGVLGSRVFPGSETLRAMTGLVRV